MITTISINPLKAGDVLPDAYKIPCVVPDSQQLRLESLYFTMYKNIYFIIIATILSASVALAYDIVFRL